MSILSIKKISRTSKIGYKILLYDNNSFKTEIFKHELKDPGYWNSAVNVLVFNGNSQSYYTGFHIFNSFFQAINYAFYKKYLKFNSQKSIMVVKVKLSDIRLKGVYRFIYKNKIYKPTVFVGDRLKIMKVYKKRTIIFAFKIFNLINFSGESYGWCNAKKESKSHKKVYF